MATTSNSRGGKVLVGFGKRDITPPLPFPMAGMADKKERLAEKIRDPLYARALAFSDGQTVALVVSLDLLLVTAHLRWAVEKRLAGLGVIFNGLMMSATHTHSSTGGYWDAPSAELFLGKYRPAIFEHLVVTIADAAAAAVADLQPAGLRYGETQTSYLNYNRRHKDGAIDRTLGVLTITRRDKTIRAVSFGAHPVVAGFREYLVASADYPGALIKTFEAEGEEGFFIVGPVGGVNVLYPEGPLDIDVHLRLLARLMREEVETAVSHDVPVNTAGGVAFAAEECSIKIIAPRLLPDRWRWADELLYPVRWWIKRFGERGLLGNRQTRVPVVRVGDLIFTGFPADLGAGVSLAVRERIAAIGEQTMVVASQTDDYVGYVHLPPDYQQLETEDKSALWMGLYENGMAFGGRQVGADLLLAFERALAKV